jgi:hypothetical protein
MAQQNSNILKEEAVIKKLIFFLKINEHLAIGVGRNYANFLGKMSETMNKFYLFYSS